MIRTMVYHRKKIWVVFLICIMLLLGLVGRLWYLMNVRAEYYSKKAEDLHERERDIKAARGKILDIRGNILADNRTVCTVSVIHSQIKDPEKVIRVLSGALSEKEEEIRKKVEKISSIERIQTNVEKSIGDRIREYDLEGVKVDESCDLSTLFSGKYYIFLIFCYCWLNQKFWGKFRGWTVTCPPPNVYCWFAVIFCLISGYARTVLYHLCQY